MFFFSIFFVDEIVFATRAQADFSLGGSNSNRSLMPPSSSRRSRLAI